MRVSFLYVFTKNIFEKNAFEKNLKRCTKECRYISSLTSQVCSYKDVSEVEKAYKLYIIWLVKSAFLITFDGIERKRMHLFQPKYAFIFGSIQVNFKLA